MQRFILAFLSMFIFTAISLADNMTIDITPELTLYGSGDITDDTGSPGYWVINDRYGDNFDYSCLLRTYYTVMPNARAFLEWDLSLLKCYYDYDPASFHINSVYLYLWKVAADYDIYFDIVEIDFQPTSYNSVSGTFSNNGYTKEMAYDDMGDSGTKYEENHLWGNSSNAWVVVFNFDWDVNMADLIKNRLISGYDWFGMGYHTQSPNNPHPGGRFSPRGSSHPPRLEINFDYQIPVEVFTFEASSSLEKN